MIKRDEYAILFYVTIKLHNFTSSVYFIAFVYIISNIAIDAKVYTFVVKFSANGNFFLTLPSSSEYLIAIILISR